MEKTMEEKLSNLTELIKLAKIDKKEKNEEYEFLYYIAQLLGVDKETFDRLFWDYADFVAPPLEADRITRFHGLVLVANVDLEVDERERKFLFECGLKLGLNPIAVETVLEEMQHYERGMIPTDRLIEIFQVHHN